MTKHIRIGSKTVPVSDEVFREYHRMARREKYMEKDIKYGRTVIDSEKDKVIFIHSKEVSVQDLMEQGAEFADEKSAEDVVCDKAMVDILLNAISELNHEEQELINEIYYKNLTTRDIAKQNNVCQTSIVKRHKKIINKIKKIFL